MDITSDSHSQHISRQFNQELEELKTHLMAMGGLVEKQVQDAVHALLEGDSRLAEKVRDNDRQVNDLQLQIDDECTRVLARRQPAASDLAALEPHALMRALLFWCAVAAAQASTLREILREAGLEARTEAFEVQHVDLELLTSLADDQAALFTLLERCGVALAGEQYRLLQAIGSDNKPKDDGLAAVLEAAPDLRDQRGGRDVPLVDVGVDGGGVRVGLGLPLGLSRGLGLAPSPSSAEVSVAQRTRFRSRP